MNIDNEHLNKTAMTNEPSEKYTYTVSEIACKLQIGKSKAYELCNQGLFKTLKIGRAVRVLRTSFDKWLSNQIK